MLLVYTHKITPRLRYVFKFICKRILNIDVSFTITIEEFIAHDSLKMSYTNQPLGKEFFVKSRELLFEQGLSDIMINVSKWDETDCFFPNGERSNLPFDIFAATFYLISRYEEYLPHVKDEFGRFTAKESLAFKHDFLDSPVVDVWAYKFRAALQEKFPNFKFTNRTYKVEPVIDVPSAYYYKRKGLLRTFGGTLNDLYRLKFKSFYQRFLVLFSVKKDPYDTFNWIINKQKHYKEKFVVFFLIGAYSTYDKNININKKGFVSLIKSVADYCHVGLKVSFLALNKTNTLKREIKQMEGILNRELSYSRNSFSKVNLPESYRNLIDQEITKEYSMGYVNEIGFRAGTCTPFLFYDIDYETTTPLEVYPYQLMDFSLLRFKSFLDKKESLERIQNKVKHVNGTFIPVFHNYTFGNDERWEGFKELFDIALK